MKKFAALIGHPIHNSLTPAMQRAALAANGLDVDFHLWDTGEEDLPDKIVEDLRSGLCLGAQVSIPYRKKILPKVDYIRPSAKLSGACNVIVSKDGKLTAHNTDVDGFRIALGGFNPEGKRIVLLGAGGAASAALAVLTRRTVTEIAVWNRNLGELTLLQDHLYRADCAAPITYTCSSFPPASIEHQATFQRLTSTADLIVQATSVGMSSGPTRGQTLLTTEMFSAKNTVLDVVANPIITPFLEEARTAGASIISGMEMLLHASATAFYLLTNQKASLDAMRTAAEAEFARQQQS